MTDREKLIDIIVRTPCVAVSSEYAAEHIIDNLIANGVTFQKWIPVTERLPEDDLPKDSKKKIIKVLVTYKTSNGVPVVRTNTRQKERWYKSEGWDWAVSNHITHWMPLPEPPQEE